MHVHARSNNMLREEVVTFTRLCLREFDNKRSYVISIKPFYCLFHSTLSHNNFNKNAIRCIYYIYNIYVIILVLLPTISYPIAPDNHLTT